jgi:hypothetical protein
MKYLNHNKILSDSGLLFVREESAVNVFNLATGEHTWTEYGGDAQIVWTLLHEHATKGLSLDGKALIQQVRSAASQ